MRLRKQPNAVGGPLKLRKKFKWLFDNKSTQCCISKREKDWLLIVYYYNTKFEFPFDNSIESLCSYISGSSTQTPDVYNKDTIKRFLRKRGCLFD